MKITTLSKICILGILGGGITTSVVAIRSSVKYPLKIQRILDWSKKHGGCTIHLVQSYAKRESYPPYENNWDDNLLEHVWKSLTEHDETKNNNESECKSTGKGILRLSNQSGNNKWKKDTNSW